MKANHRLTISPISMRMQFMQLGLDTCLGTGMEEARLFSTEVEVSVSSVLRLQEVRRPQPIAVNTSKAMNPDKMKKHVDVI